ncbi:MAG: acetolactate synthase large subunit, partial [Marinobacter sp.]|nr:acetolactate synthase large subunit [Marinobacter sp.]
INDSAYGMIKWKQGQEGYPDFGLDYRNPDFVTYAQSYGAKGHRVTRTEDLSPTLESALAEGGVHLVEVPVDYSENRRVFDEELAELTCRL